MDDDVFREALVHSTCTGCQSLRAVEGESPDAGEDA